MKDRFTPFFEDLFMKVCIIDDEIDICESLAEFFQEIGHEVVFYTNPQLACENIEKDFFDYIICDFIMPELSGKEVLQKLPARCFGQFFFLTGETNLSDEMMAQLKCDKIYFKPSGILELIELFESLAKKSPLAS